MTLSNLSSCANAQPVALPEAPFKAGETMVSRHGQLRVQGNKIVDKNGNPVILRGMSLFWSQWIGQYFTPGTVSTLKNDWHCTIVRAAMGVGYGGYLENPEKEKQRVIAVVDAAIKEGIYVLIDWHDHEAETHVEESKKFFAEMAQKYGKYPNVIYETFNEPLEQPTWSQGIKPYHEAVIKEIRRYDPDNIVVCGTRVWSQRVDEAADDPLPFTNIAYTLHFYSGTHKQWLRDIAQKALDKGICIWVTEFGTTEASGDGPLDLEETQKWLDFMDKNGISWSNWSVADKKETSAVLQPGASGDGGWSDDMITPSGLYVREEIRRKNPMPALIPVTKLSPLPAK